MPSLSRLDNCRSSKTSIRLLAFSMVLAVAAPTLFAQEWDHWDHLNGRDKIHDPTGAWFLRIPIDPLKREFLLVVFHKGGTLTSDFQGESAFDPSAVPLPPTDPNFGNNVLSSPGSGVWQKTGWNTFAGLLMDMEYHNAFNPALVPLLPPDVSILQFAKFQFSGRLSPSGDTMTFNAHLTRYNPKGEAIPGTPSDSFKGTGTRIPLEILPFTSETLLLPPTP